MWFSYLHLPIHSEWALKMQSKYLQFLILKLFFLQVEVFSPKVRDNVSNVTNAVVKITLSDPSGNSFGNQVSIKMLADVGPNVNLDRVCLAYFDTTTSTWRCESSVTQVPVSKLTHLHKLEQWNVWRRNKSFHRFWTSFASRLFKSWKLQ